MKWFMSLRMSRTIALLGAVDGANALQPEAVIEAGPRKHGIDENLLLDRAERSQFELSGDFANSLH